MRFSKVIWIIPTLVSKIIYIYFEINVLNFSMSSIITKMTTLNLFLTNDDVTKSNSLISNGTWEETRKSWNLIMKEHVSNEVIKE